MMESNDYIIAREPDILYLKEALEDFAKELKQLELMNEWFYSEARHKLEESVNILKALLEEEDNEQDDDDEWTAEAERLFAELCFGREGAESYLREIEEDE